MRFGVGFGKERVEGTPQGFRENRNRLKNVKYPPPLDIPQATNYHDFKPIQLRFTDTLTRLP